MQKTLTYVYTYVHTIRYIHVIKTQHAYTYSKRRRRKSRVRENASRTHESIWIKQDVFMHVYGMYVCMPVNISIPNTRACAHTHRHTCTQSYARTHTHWPKISRWLMHGDKRDISTRNETFQHLLDARSLGQRYIFFAQLLAQRSHLAIKVPLRHSHPIISQPNFWAMRIHGSWIQLAERVVLTSLQQQSRLECG